MIKYLAKDKRSKFIYF